MLIRHAVLGCLDLFPDHGRVLKTARKAWDTCLLTTGVNVVVCHEVWNLPFQV